MITFYPIQPLAAFLMVPSFLTSCLATFASLLFMTSSEEVPVVVTQERVGVTRVGAAVRKED